MSKLQVDSVDEVTSANGVTIDGLNIKDSKLTTANSVVTTNITDANVTTAKITDANVTTAKIADANVTTAKIADANITVAKMAANSVDSNQYVDGSIDTAHIANDQITNALMADNAIDTAQIAASAVETAKINDDAVTLAKMAPGTDGNIISYDASGNPVAVATGNDGQVLTSTGAGSPPAFETPSGVTLSGSTNNQVATVTGANALTGESNLLFSGNDLTVGVSDNGKVKSTAALTLECPAGEDLKFNTGGANERMRINPAGNMILGSTSQVNASKLSLKYANTANDGLGLEQTNNDTLGYAVIFKNTNGIVGTITNQNSATAFNTSSDYRLKENVDYTFDATTRLKQLKPARFNFIVDDNNTLVDGFIAHEVSDIVPEAISGEKDATETKEKVVVNTKGNVIAENIEQDDWQNGKITDEDGNTQYPTDSTWEATKVVPIHQGIDQSKLVPLLVKTIQELEARITQLENN